ncbi:THUMP domain-containing protein 2 isoform X1 [Bufo gargarizans]|uniref:THUMP domain-containing protein 2 isoform X1 n=1 Tax=Bufo gargarizans TaxID=30331 RepID=UPI001CF4F504|nr:THUMP domain-containing protein 2 isoform X1 [Bufo gargarizans]
MSGHSAPHAPHLHSHDFFCTVGRGMERFVMQELTSKLSAVVVESIPGKVFFKGNPDLCLLRKVKSAERIFLLLRKGPPLTEYKGNALFVLRKFIIGKPHLWLDKLLIWETFQDQLSQQGISYTQQKGLKRKLDNDSTESKSETRKEETVVDGGQSNDHGQTPTDTIALLLSQKLPVEDSQDTVNPLLKNKISELITFRVSCRCSGAYTKTMTAQDIGRVIGVSLAKQFGWKPDLRRPLLEVFVHLNDMHSVVGFPILRQPLANRYYIQNTGLRATTAWAMASLAEISTAKYVLDPMCGVGTILLEAAMEWPHATFLGIDNSESQLKHALDNVKKADVMNSVAFLKGSVLGLPVLSESMDVVISDIPFGKKFTCSKDMKELLPDIIRQMERVLRIGGVLVLLLSQKLHYYLKKHFYFKSKESENLKIFGSDSPSTCTSEGSKAQEQITMKIFDFTSLTHIESHSVSLGVTEAVLFKCKKTSQSVFF